MSNPFIEVIDKQRALQHFHQCKNKLNDVGDELDIVYKENERLRKALDDIDEEAVNTYENSETPELNDCIDKMQQIAIQARKESK